MRKITVRLPEPVIVAAKQQAAQEFIPLSDLVLRAVEAELKRVKEEKKA
jgi:predicted DNA binding CopG/RHH family protein